MDPIPSIDTSLSGLHDARPAGVFPFLVEGEVVWVRGVASRPELRVGRGRHVIATIRPAGLGAAANVLLFPGIVRRDFASALGSVVETVLATPTLPLVVVQWAADRGGLPESIGVELHDASRAGDLPLDIDGAGGRLVAEVVDGARIVVHAGVVDASAASSMEIQLAPDAAKATVRAVADGIGAVLRPQGGDHVSLVLALASGTGQERRPPSRPGVSGRAQRGRPASAVADAARHTSGHAVRAARGPTEGLLLRSGLKAADDGVAWLRARLAGQAHRLTLEAPPAAALSIGLAASLVGDRGASEAALASTPDDSPTRALLAARHAAVFGDTAAAWESARRWAERADVASNISALAPLAAQELADALHLSGDPETISSLRRIALLGRSAPTERRADPSRSPSGVDEAGGRTLPMAGRASPSDPTARLRGLLTGDPSALAPTVQQPALEAAYRATATFQSEPDAAWMEWRRLLGQGDGSGRMVTLWDESDPGSPEGQVEPPAGRSEEGSSFVGGSLTAELLLALASGLLGLRSDAAAGRIRIAPTLPGHLTRFEVSGITVGGSTISMRYAVEGDMLRYELTPETGSVPPLLVFEPSIDGRPLEVRIDGNVAELDPRQARGRTVVPVQLPLDAVRTVEIMRSGA